MFLTAAFDDIDSVFQGYRVGAVDYLLKPVDPDILRAKVAVFIELYTKKAQLAAEVAQRQRAEAELSRVNASLEIKIRERTASLLAVNEALRREVEVRKRVEEDLRGATTAAESASLAKSAFLANMSHEIRTPMNAIIGMTDVALQTELTAEQRQYLDLARAASESLLFIINGVLDFSKIEAGRLELETIAFSLRECLSEMMKPLALQAHDKGLKFEYEIAPETPDALVADPTRLRQILSNLVGNAIKFTECGEVVMRVWPEIVEDGDAVCHFTVSDTGIGIPQDKQAVIFAPFQQGDSSTTRLYGGTGLGLAIAARLVAMMNGRIWVESEPGKGSTFHFVARVGLQGAPEAVRDAVAAEHGPRTAAPAGANGSLTVLLVEDNAVNRRLAQIVLEREGHKVVAVDNGAAALEVFRREPADVVLMDLQMPRMDGIETTLAMRELEKTTNTHVPIIALTAHAMASDRERCLKAGMDGYLTKPVQPSMLLRAIGRPAVARGPPAPAGKVVLDRAALVDRVDGDPQLLEEIVELYFGNYGKLMTEASQAMAAADAVRFGQTLHTLAGMFRNLAAKAAEDLTEMLQALDVTHERDRAQTIWVMLEQEVQRLNAELQSLVYERAAAGSDAA
jgi:signal transduction histidine kinase/HPt (histidine-containing phosphotransfer) domain-containing protein